MSAFDTTRTFSLSDVAGCETHDGKLSLLFPPSRWLGFDFLGIQSGDPNLSFVAQHLQRYVVVVVSAQH